MKSRVSKRIIIGLIVIITTVLIGYGGYKLYNYAVDVAIQRVKKAVRKNVVDTINPVKWVGGIFGGKKKHKDDSD